MATFKVNTSITGSFRFGFSSGSGDPGTIWFDTGSQELRLRVYSPGLSAWAVGDNTNTTHTQGIAAGTPTNGLALGGPACTNVQAEEYNGGVWSNVTNMPNARCAGQGAGSQNDAIAFGGGPVFYIPVNGRKTDEYDGSTWSAGGCIITNGRYQGAAAGTRTAGLAFGGIQSPGAAQACATEAYNGVTSTWATVPSAPFGTVTPPATRIDLAGAGTQNAALSFGGVTPTGVYKYDGSSWSTGPGLSTGTRCCLGGAGSQNAAFAIGGSFPSNPSTTCVEEFNGTSWSTSIPQIGNTRVNNKAAGATSAAAFTVAGTSPSALLTEEFTFFEPPGPVTKDI